MVVWAIGVLRKGAKKTRKDAKDIEPMKNY